MPNADGKFDFFREGANKEIVTATMPVCLKFPGCSGKVGDCKKVGNFVQRCVLNLKINNRNRTQRAAAVMQVPVPDLMSFPSGSDNSDMVKEQDDTMDDMMKMMCCLVTRATDDPGDLAPLKKVSRSLVMTRSVTSKMPMFVCGKSVRWPCLFILVCPLPRRVCPQLLQVDDRRSDIVEQIVNGCVCWASGPWHVLHAVLMTQVHVSCLFFMQPFRHGRVL